MVIRKSTTNGAEISNDASVVANIKKQTITETRVPGISKVAGVRGASYLMRLERPPDPVTSERRQESKTYKTMKEAERAQIERRAEMQRGVAVDTSKLTVGDVCKQWLALKRHDLKPRSYEHYEHAVNTHIVPHIGGLAVQRIQPTTIDTLYTLLRDAGHSEHTIHRVHQRLRQLFDYAVKRRIVAVNSVTAVDAPTMRPAPATILTASQIGRFLTFATDDGGYAPLWLLLLQTGLRRGEALGVRWQDIDLETGKLRVRQAVELLNGVAHFTTPKTPAALRTITLFPESIAALKEYRTRQLRQRLVATTWGDHDLVFCTDIGKPLHPENVLRAFYAIRRRANEAAKQDNAEPLPAFRIHDLRHTHATHLIRERWDIVTVSRRLGHANPGITMTIYAHSLADVPDGDLATPAAFTLPAPHGAVR